MMIPAVPTGTEQQENFEPRGGSKLEIDFYKSRNGIHSTECCLFLQRQLETVPEKKPI